MAVTVGIIANSAIAYAQEKNQSGRLTDKEKIALLEALEDTKMDLVKMVYALLDERFNLLFKKYKSDQKMVKEINDIKERIKQEIPSTAEELILDLCHTIKTCRKEASDFNAVQIIFTNAVQQAYERARKTADAYDAAAFAYVVKKNGASIFQNQANEIKDYFKFINAQRKEIDIILPFFDEEIKKKVAEARKEEIKKHPIVAKLFPEKFEKQFQTGLLESTEHQEAQKARQYIANFINKLKSEIKDISSSFNNVQITLSQIHQRLKNDSLTVALFNARITSVNEELDTIQKAMGNMIILLNDRHLKELKEKYKVDLDLASKITQFEQLVGQLKAEREALRSDAEKIALFRDALEKGGDITKPFQLPPLSPSLSSGEPRKPPAQSPPPGGVSADGDRLAEERTGQRSDRNEERRKALIKEILGR